MERAFRKRLTGAKWRRIRLRLLNERGWRCERCQRPGKLELHHADGDPSHADPERLQVLCRSCHISIHKPEVSPKVAAWQALIDRT